jgi:putative phosphoribosyl transferase
VLPSYWSVQVVCVARERSAAFRWALPYTARTLIPTFQSATRFQDESMDRRHSDLDLASMSTPQSPVSREVRIPSAREWLFGDLAAPPAFRGVVLFAHGSGSSRHSSRNRQVARYLQQAGLATLLFDLLTAEEEQVDAITREHRFDLQLLRRRIADATAWVSMQPELREARMGYFGASTGSAAALIAAANRPTMVSAVVSRGGRPDLAGQALSQVEAPTLLIVGGADHGVIELNQQAFAQLRCEKDLLIVPGATHLFEEAGTLEQVCHAAASWFTRHLAMEEHA